MCSSKYLVLIFNLLLCFVDSIHGLDILAIFPYTGKSHHYVIDPLLNKLTQDGHRITFIGHFPAESPKPNRTDIILQSNISMKTETVDLNMLTHVHLQIIFEMLFLTSFGKEMCDSLLNDPRVMNIIQNKNKFDIALVEQFNTDCPMGLIHKLGIPSIGMASDTLFPWHYDRFGSVSNPSFVPCHNLGYGTSPNFWETAISLVTCSGMNIFYYVNSIRPTNEMFRKHFGDNFPQVQHLVKGINAVLINSYFPLHGSLPYGNNIIEVGGIHLQNTKKLPSDIQKYLDDATDGVVYFSMGSMIRTSSLPSEKLKAFQDVFAQLPLKVLWKWENESMENVPSNVLVRKWLPQFDILNHKNVKVFISHGGMLSTTEAAHCGVPMVTIPLYGDQFANAAAVEASGLGTILHYRDINYDNIMKAIQIALDTKTQESAKRLSEIWKDRPISPMDTAVFWIEHVAKYGGKHLRPASADLPLYKYLLLDVIALLSLIAVCIIFISYKIIVFTILCICRPFRTKPKRD